ncbi:protein of unknown function [Shewanella benthica]|uniref:Uncharacterized protein n=1 Tax=Shewanella benthica TaxID=43661 RepID=A0A330LYD1_9GAMM|nr:protein of unknown function [Shewanella benthica]
MSLIDKLIQQVNDVDYKSAVIFELHFFKLAHLLQIGYQLSRMSSKGLLSDRSNW